MESVNCVMPDDPEKVTLIGGEGESSRVRQLIGLADARAARGAPFNSTASKIGPALIGAPTLYRTAGPRDPTWDPYAVSRGIVPNLPNP